jgi:hypothetical protein
MEDMLSMSLFGLLPTGVLLPSKNGFAQQASEKRLVLIHSPDGHGINYWPQTTSPTGSITLSPIFSPFAGLESQLSLVRGIVGPRGSHKGIGCLYTGVNSDGGEDSTNIGAASLDQYVANAVAAGTPHRSIALGAIGKDEKPGETLAFFDNSGNGISPFMTPKQAIDAHFQDVFALSGNFLAPSQTNLNTPGNSTAMLEFLDAEVKRLLQNPRLAQHEKQKLALHAASVQQMIASAEASDSSGSVSTAPSLPQALQCQKLSAGINRNYDSRGQDDYEPMVDAYIDLIAAGISCRKSNVFTLQLGKSAESWKHKTVGQGIPRVNGFDSHAMTHQESYYPDKDNISNQELYDLTRQRAQAVSTWFAGKVANLARKLAAIPEGTGTVLDNTLIVWASEFGSNEAKDHGVGDLGFLLVGGKNLGFATGKYTDLGGNKRANSVLLSTIAQAYGVTEQVGREGGTISELKRS